MRALPQTNFNVGGRWGGIAPQIGCSPKLHYWCGSFARVTDFCCTSLAQADGGFAAYKHQEEYEVESLKSMRIKEGKVEYLVSWVNFDQTYDTWERENNISPDLVEDFHDKRDITVDTVQTDFDLSEAVAAELMRRARQPEHGFQVSVPSATYAPVAHALNGRESSMSNV